MLAGAISAALTGTAWAGGLTSDADHGDALYESCQDCHSFDKNDIGPRQRWVLGRPLAAGLRSYSDALKSEHVERGDTGQVADRSSGCRARRQNVLSPGQSAGPGRCDRLPQEARQIGRAPAGRAA